MDDNQSVGKTRASYSEQASNPFRDEAIIKDERSRVTGISAIGCGAEGVFKGVIGAGDGTYLMDATGAKFAIDCILVARTTNPKTNNRKYFIPNIF